VKKQAEAATAPRGIWERVPGSGVWWVRWRDGDGRLHREKAGSKSIAISLLNKRREGRRIGAKLPENLRSAGVRFGVLADDIVTWSKAHHRDHKHTASRVEIIRADFGERIADSIKPQDIDVWLTRNTNTPATSNRYRALFSLIFREALKNGKVKSNPARLIQQKREGSVIRYLGEHEGEEEALRNTVRKHYPEREVEIDIAIGTGMRLSEQYGLTWGAVNLAAKEIRLSRTKNNSARTIPMSNSVFAAFTELRKRARKPKRTDPVFASLPRYWFEDVLAKSKIAKFRWHDFRHTFCSRLAMAGKNLRVIQDLAGHKTIQMSARYAHLDKSSLREAVESLK
jgi:integrase